MTHVIDIDVSAVFDGAHGEGRDKPPDPRDPFALADATDDMAVRLVCRKLLELWQAFENLRLAVLSCGDCVRFRVSVPKGGRWSSGDAISRAVVMAALVDGGSDRAIYLEADHDFEEVVFKGLHAASDVGSYVSRRSMRLRRPQGR